MTDHELEAELENTAARVRELEAELEATAIGLAGERNAALKRELTRSLELEEAQSRVRELEGELHTVRQQDAEAGREPEAKPLPAGDAPADVGERLHQAYRALYSAHGIKLAAWDGIGDWEREWWKGLARKPATIGAERDAAKAERDEAKTAAQYASDEVDARNKRIAELERDVDWYKEAKTDRGIELDRVRRDREQAQNLLAEVKAERDQARDAETAEKTAKEEAWTEAKQLRERLNKIAAYTAKNAGLAEAPEF